MKNEKPVMNQNSNMKIPGMRRGPMQMETEKPREGKKTLSRLLQYFGRQKKSLVLLLFSVIVVVVSTVYAPKVQSDAVDILASGDFGRLPKYLLLMVILYVVLSLFSLIQNLISAKLSQQIVKNMREDLFQKIVHLPVRYLDCHSHGDVMSRMTNDVENISNTVSQSLASLAAGVLTIIGTVVMMVSLCWELALLSCCTVVLTLVVTKYMSKMMRRFFRKKQVLLGELNGTVEEMVTNYKTVVANNRQESVIDEFNRTSNELTKTGIKAEILGGSMGPLMNSINNIGFVIIAAFGGYFAIHEQVTIGIISAFIVYAKQFGRPINEIAQIYAQIETAIAGAERIFEVMDEQYEDQGGKKHLSNENGIISFQNVVFSYEPGKAVIRDFSLDVYAGHKVALVGATGSGKTTIVNLLMRFYDVDSGKILINSVDIRDIPLTELRNHIAIVLQDTVLFSDTVRHNLTYSNQSVEEEKMLEAAKMSNCDKMIRSMKNGYDTYLTAAGDNLSHGQRQLLSIGRAFLADPQILILDEATSSVDTRTEKHIQDAMVNLMKNRTSLIIAHRLSTIQDADLIVVMDQGRIIEMGNHEELLQKKGKYSELYFAQFMGNEI